MAVYEVEFPDGVYEVEFPDQPQQKSSEIGYDPKQGYGANLLKGFKEIPETLFETVKSIPSGLENLYDLPANLSVAGIDALKLAYQGITGDQTMPYDYDPSLPDKGASKAADRYGQLERTFRGVGALGAGVASGGIAPVLVPAGLEGFKQLNQLTGSDKNTTAEQDLKEILYNLGQTAPIMPAAKAIKNTGNAAAKILPVADDVDTLAGRRIADWTQDPAFADSLEQQIARTADDPFAQFKSTAEIADSSPLMSAERTLTNAQGDPIFQGKMIDRNAARDTARIGALDNLEAQALGEAGLPIKPEAEVQSILARTLSEADESVALRNLDEESALVAQRQALENDVRNLTRPIEESRILPEESGRMIGENIKNKYISTREEVSSAFESLPNEKFDLDVEAQALDAAIQRYPDSKFPSGVADILERLQGKEAETSLILDPSTRKPAELPRPQTTLREYQALRREIGKKRNASSDPTEKGFYSNIADLLDSSVDEAGQAGRLNPVAFERLQEARGKRLTQGEVFERSSLAPIIKPPTYNKSMMPDALIPQKIIVPGEKGFVAMKDYIRAVGKAEDALEPVYKEYLTKFADTAIGKDGLVDNGAASRFINRYQHSLRLLPDLRAKLKDVVERQQMVDEFVGRPKRTPIEIQDSTFRDLTAVNPQDVVPRLLGKKNSMQAIREIKNTLQNDPNGLASLRNVAKNFILKESVEFEKLIKDDGTFGAGEGKFSKAKFNGLMKNYGAELKEVFTPAQFKVLEQVYGDVKSQQAVQSARAGTGSQTTGLLTGLEAIKNSVSTSLVRRMPYVGDFAAKMLTDLRKTGLDKVNARVAEAIIENPKLAIELLRKATPERMNRSLPMIFDIPPELATASVATLAPAQERRKTVVQEVITSDKSFPTPEEVYKPSETTLKKKSDDMARTPEFDAKVDQIAANLETDPAHLMKAMAFETGGTFDAGVKNKAGSGATGLIQFMPKTAQGLTGADSKEAAIEILQGMNEVEQLDYVEKYLKPFKGKLNSLSDVYMAILWPKAVGKDSQYALFREGTKAYWQNRGLDLDGDGVITKEEATSKVRNFKV